MEQTVTLKLSDDEVASLADQIVEKLQAKLKERGLRLIAVPLEMED